MMTILRSRHLVTGLAMAALAATAACDNHDHDEITVSQARVEVLSAAGAVVQTMTVTPNGVTGGPLVLTQNINATLRVTWLDAAGAADPANTDADFQVRFAPPAGSGLTFTLNSGSASTGVMRGTSVQTTAVNVGLQLFHTVENHTDFDATLPVRVNGGVVVVEGQQ